MVVPWFNRRDPIKKLKHRNGIRFFSYETLQIATNNFSNLIGRGGFGSVFKGFLPDDRRPVAIKRLDDRRRQHPDEFLEMVEYMSHLRHTNLIQLIGCCVTKDFQLLVSEYAEKGSVSQLLCDSTRSALNWERRASVCIGTARGLSYLHEDINPQVIHRDIKLPNILLDDNFVPKIADFDLVSFVNRNSRLSVVGAGAGERTTAFGDSNTEDLHVETLVCGTCGYLDPEYVFTGKCTKKVDVYAFGLVMLEIISGEHRYVFPKDGGRGIEDRLSYAITLRKDGRVLELVDPMLIEFPKDDVERFLHVALLCTQPDSKQRPNMFEVMLMLYGVYKSNQEISEMSMGAVTANTPPWYRTISVHSYGDSPPSCAPEEPDAEDEGTQDVTPCSSQSSIVLNRGNSGPSGQGNETSEATPEPIEPLPPASSTMRVQSCEMTDVSSYFQRSIQKMKEFQASSASFAASNGTTSMAQTTVIKRVSMEAVYPPFPCSWEYPPSNAFCNRKWQ